ncbi:serine hydrolase domain-containing protein [Spirillospora sp. NPDC047279]|uniref:serine hydrolase domain-containing protein n=1 Tax=Spirillospora sp. NPDC047279 TaxID=3155478 RepID=UPI0033E0BB89
MSRIRRWTSAGAVTAAGLATAAVAMAQPASAGNLYQEQLDRYRVATGALGGMVVVRHGGKVAGLGSGNVEKGTDTRFRVGSQTKMLTAALVLQLADEGKVGLDDPIGRHLPGVVKGKGLDPNAITVRQLLQHRSGIKDNLGFVNGDYLQTAQLLLNPWWQIVPPTRQQMVNEGTKYGKQAEPGARGVYSNTGYTVLGMLVEKLTGTDLTTAMKTRIIDRVGMPSTFYPRPGQKQMPEPFARGYLSLKGAAFADVTNFEPAVWGAAAGLVSTGRDMTKFVNALASGQVVSPKRLAEMRRTSPVINGVGDYGLGLKAFPTACGTAWGHTGSVAGYSTYTLGKGSRSISIGINNTPVISDPNDAAQRMIDQALCG